MANLTITINQLRNQQGEVCIALFESEVGFPKDDTQAVRNRCFAITELPMSVSFDVPYGSYSASVLHDENKDGELETGLMGIPQEGIGFSNDPMIITGTPNFETASFEFSADNAAIEITMKYF